MDYLQYIERNPQICGGEPVIKGTRVTLRTLLASLAEGARIEEITADFPTVSVDAVRAVIAFAAASAYENAAEPPESRRLRFPCQQRGSIGNDQHQQAWYSEEISAWSSSAG